MTRRSGAVVGVVIAILLLAAWWLLRDGAPESRAPGKGTVAGRGTAASIASSAPWSDPRTQPRASISGRITDQQKAPLARAQVCTSPVGSALPSALTRVLTCALTDEHGRYRIGELVAASYVVHASARGFRPGAFFPAPGMANHEMALAAGEARTGVDVELKRGGAEITGVVLDASGGPVTRAEVREATRGSAHAGAAAETDEQGRFSLWTERGHVTLEASADGYVPAHGTSRSPGTIEISLMPASSLAGTVIDAATGQPVAGAQVELELDGERDSEVRDITAAQGAFRLEPLEPGRYTVAARAEHGYGRSPGALLVGLGQHVDGAVVKLFPAHRVAGKVVIAGSARDCAGAQVQLLDRTSDRMIELREQPGGLRVADGLLPGTYNVTVHCASYVARDGYEPVIVGDRDVTGVVWEVEEGARIRGKVVSRSGVPVDGASVRAQSIGGARGQTAWSQARSKADGSFELRGLRAGTHMVAVAGEGVRLPSGAGTEVTVAPSATLERDFVIDDTGTLSGSVVDGSGGAVPGISVMITSSDGRSYFDRATSDDAGAFLVDALPAGDYRVVTYSAESDSIADEQRATVAVRGGQTATVKLTVESRRGTITGTVVDAANQPVPDAFLSWARESDGPRAHASMMRTREEWRREARPVMTAPDGSFQLAGLVQGTYTVRAYRKGGGEAIAEHIAIGATARLEIKPTGSITGTARTGAPVRDIAVQVRDARTGFHRSESFYMTGGQFQMTDLPAGHFDILVEADGNQAMTTVDLRDGEARTGVDVELTPLVTVTGRLVEHGTQRPVPGYHITASPAHGAGRMDTIRRGSDTDNVSDEAGRFTLRRVAAGDVLLLGFPRDTGSAVRTTLEAFRTIRGTGTVDLGDVPLIVPRVKQGEPTGVLGLRFEAASPDQRPGPPELKIAAIDPAGPAAATGLQVGDVITTCDGVDVTGRGATSFGKLVKAPPGTKLMLGTRRGVTVTLVLGPPATAP